MITGLGCWVFLWRLLPPNAVVSADRPHACCVANRTLSTTPPLIPLPGTGSTAMLTAAAAVESMRAVTEQAGCCTKMLMLLLQYHSTRSKVDSRRVW